MDAHTGPIIIGGDFNTWGRWRTRHLNDVRDSLNLKEVTFQYDIRTRAFGGILDRVLVRGLDVVESKVFALESSDHFPLAITLVAK